MGKELKRMRYFDGLFLDANAYKLDQEYQRRLQQLHDRYLHTWGIVSGLKIKPAGGCTVSVTKGLALNQVTLNSEKSTNQLTDGESVSQLIYIYEGHPESTIDLSTYEPGVDIYIYVSYLEELADKDKYDQGNGNEIHVWERGSIGYSASRPVDEKKEIILAKVQIIQKVDENNNSIKYIDESCISYYESDKKTSLRTYAGPAGEQMILEKVIFRLDDENITGDTTTDNAIKDIRVAEDNKTISSPFIKAIKEKDKTSVDALGIASEEKILGLEINSMYTEIQGSVNVLGDLKVNGTIHNETGSTDDELLISNAFVQVNSRTEDEEWTPKDGGLEVYRGETTDTIEKPGIGALLTWSEKDKWWEAGFENDVYKVAYGPEWETLTKNQTADKLHMHEQISWADGTPALKAEEDTEHNLYLSVNGNMSLNDKTIWFRSQSNLNNGLGWFGNGKTFAGVNVDGPVLFGHAGGILGIVGDDQVQKSIISWNKQGNVGIGVTDPKDDNLEVSGKLRILSSTNPIRFTSEWSDFSNNTGNGAEICNDTTKHKALVITGNNSSGQGRKVAIWDRLDVNGFLNVNGDIQLTQALTPSAGNGNNGIIFPSDPGGGGWDSAWIKYYPRTGEACTLEIGVSNDGDDNIFLNASGCVGIGTINPAEKVDVSGWMRVMSGSNPLRFTSAWSGFPDRATNQAEISNDTTGFKSLMIVGNSSSGQRKVSIWDRLDVNGNLKVNGDLQTHCAIVPSVGNGENNGISFPKDYYGGSGDAAWIRYYSDLSRGGGENMTLEIGIANDYNSGGYYGGGDRIRLFATGGVYVDGYFYYSSSRELKENISGLSTSKAKKILEGLNPVSFNFKGDVEKTTLGFIAEDVPKAVAAVDQKAISPMEIITVLTSVVKDHKKTISKLQQQVDELTNTLN